jgi:hypothetical protein
MKIRSTSSSARRSDPISSQTWTPSIRPLKRRDQRADRDTYSEAVPVSATAAWQLFDVDQAKRSGRGTGDRAAMLGRHGHAGACRMEGLKSGPRNQPFRPPELFRRRTQQGGELADQLNIATAADPRPDRSSTWSMSSRTLATTPAASGRPSSNRSLNPATSRL